ncbi:Flp family type IVb pilin [Arthrobacter sp. AZCC_0090]|uniref:Flp family type IVb pilin n=1 Tax=Arthrobacter sp. AZCC_0090 TaxID=2735881 RepID=UPI001612B672|nr:Flp family type IVb pilin [Arthrobacter sp. AZCC_0090]MBB6405811.1 pilus assembly protein Flp/PilA [Arthrobacter sp. AZCC_0090]
MSSLMVSVIAFVAGVKDRLTSEKGATATEYSLLVAFIALVIIAGVTLFGDALNKWFGDLAGHVGAWHTGA